MKKILVLFAAVVFTFAASAQDSQESLVKWKGFRTNGFGDNWEISAGIGVDFFAKLGHREGLENPKFGDIPAFSFDLSVGKWFTPVVGARIQMQGPSASSINYVDSSLFSWNYLFIHADVMWDLTNWFVGYKPDKTYHAILTTGFGYAHKFATDVTGPNNEYAASFGLINRFNVGSSWAVNLEAKCMLTKIDFDQINPWIRTGAQRFATGISVTAGATYKFPISTWEVAPICPDLDPYNDRIASLENDLDNAMKALDEANKQLTVDQEAKDKCAKELEEALAKLKECEARPAQTITTSASIQNTDVSFTIFFENGDALTADAQSTINQIANIIKKNDKNASYLIVGYADKSTGTYQGNMNISKKRAEKVRAALTKQGIKGAQLKVDWKGDTEQPYNVESGILNRVVVVTMIQ
ncbi:MAG: OmpA family protein [Bacteroidales bacterium]|jgi:outer membrane protein OmpA-like peptidoglycan-associated protein|nr:OmpA family protein [Bacteroidales bacterium]